MTDKESINAVLNAIDSGREFIPLSEPSLKGVVRRALKRELEIHPDNYSADYLYGLMCTLNYPALMYESEKLTVREALKRMLGEENE